MQVLSPSIALRRPASASLKAESFCNCCTDNPSGTCRVGFSSLSMLRIILSVFTVSVPQSPSNRDQRDGHSHDCQSKPQRGVLVDVHGYLEYPNKILYWLFDKPRTWALSEILLHSLQ
jgi:hypothetical protein